jgi:hypothetical protein
MIRITGVRAQIRVVSIFAALGTSGCGASVDEPEVSTGIATAQAPLLWSTDVSHERVGMPWKNSTSAGLTIRLHFVALSDDHGSRPPTVDPTFMRSIVETANATYASAKIQFAFDSARDYESVNSTALNSMANSGLGWWTGPNAYAKNYPGKLVIFLRQGAGSAFAYPPNTGAPIPSSALLPTSNVNFVRWYSDTAIGESNRFNFMHELGHYLGLFHTHPTWSDPFDPPTDFWEAVEDRNIGYFDGDLLSDTPPDPGAGYVSSAFPNTNVCTTPLTYSLSRVVNGVVTIWPVVFAPDYFNIMSYYGCPNETITAQQSALMRSTLSHATRANLLKARPPQSRLGRVRPTDNGASVVLHNVETGEINVYSPNTDGEYGAASSSVNQFCAGAHQQLYRADFNGDGHSDLLCHDRVTGFFRMDRAATSLGSVPFGSVDWDTKPFPCLPGFCSGGFCAGPSERLIVGRFNDDARADLMCLDVVSGTRVLRYAQSNGTFVLENPSPNALPAQGWSTTNSWCIGDHQSLHLGDFNDDGRDDLLCHDVVSGKLYIDHADADGHFGSTDWSRNAGFCKEPGSDLLIGNYDGIRGDDLLCHTPGAGTISQMFSDASGTFANSEFPDDQPWCKSASARLYVGDADGDQEEDLFCYNESTRKLYVAYANDFGRFNGTTDWSTSSGWGPLGPHDLK